jgi:hypothetical protein
MGSSPAKQKKGFNPILPTKGEDTEKVQQPEAAKKTKNKINPKINVPKGYGPNISDEQKKKSKGPLKGITEFEMDKTKAKSWLKNLPVVKGIKRLGGDITDMAKGTVDLHKKVAKKGYDYFTKR